MDVSIFVHAFELSSVHLYKEKTVVLQNATLNLQRYSFASVVRHCFCLWKIWPPFWRMHEISTKQILIYIKQWSYGKHSRETRLQLMPHSYHGLLELFSCLEYVLVLWSLPAAEWHYLCQTASKNLDLCSSLLCQMFLNVRDLVSESSINKPKLSASPRHSSGLSDKNELYFHYR